MKRRGLAKISSVGVEVRADALARELHVRREQRLRPPAPSGGSCADLDHASAPEREDHHVVVERRRPRLRLATQQPHQLVRAERAPVLAQQRGEALVAELAPVAPRLGEPVGAGEHDVARVQRRLAGRVDRILVDAERQPGAAQLVLGAVRAQQQRRRVARRCTSGSSPPSITAITTGTNVVPGQPPAQQRVGLGDHVGRVGGVPRARLDEEADHRADRGDLDALAADVARPAARSRRSAAARSRTGRLRRRPGRRARRRGRRRIPRAPAAAPG